MESAKKTQDNIIMAVLLVRDSMAVLLVRDSMPIESPDAAEATKPRLTLAPVLPLFGFYLWMFLIVTVKYSQI